MLFFQQYLICFPWQFLRQSGVLFSVPLTLKGLARAGNIPAPVKATSRELGDHVPACKVGTSRNTGKCKVCTFLYSIFPRTPSSARSKRSARKSSGGSSSRSGGSRIRSGIKRVTSTLRRSGGSSSHGKSCGGRSLAHFLGGKNSGGVVRPGVATAAAGAARKNKRKWLKREVEESMSPDWQVSSGDWKTSKVCSIPPPHFVHTASKVTLTP